MTKYRKKPVVIEAEQYTGNNGNALRNISGGVIVEGSDGQKKWLQIETLEGNMTADVGDWIIRGIKGELYPCKPDIFAETYEKVE